MINVRQIYLLCGCVIFLLMSKMTMGQAIERVINRVAEVERIMDSGSKTYVAGYIFDSILQTQQNKISGVQVKNGKVASTSATLQDKSMTLNVNITANSRLYFQPTITGSSTKDFISIFSGDKYQRTITGGVNVIFFTHSSGTFEKSDEYYIHNVLRFVRSWPPADSSKNELEKDISEFTKAFDAAYLLYRSMEKVDVVVWDTASASYKALKKMYELAPKLVRAKILKPDWDLYYAHDVKDSVEKLKMLHEAFNWKYIYQQKKKLESYDSVQRGAYWKRFRYSWLSGGIQYNQAINPLFDSSAGPVKLFKRDDYDQYCTAQFSWNYLSSNMDKERNTWIFPTIKFTTQKVFNTDSLLNIQKQSFAAFGSDTLVVTDKSTSFYLHDIKRQSRLTFELPVTMYWTSQKFGIDLSASFQFVPSFDQLSARAGIYIPIGASDKVVVIEPLLNFMKLNKGHLQFIKDQLAFGFSVSVSIPKFVTGN